MEYGILGERLGHSFSPMIHKMLGGYDYRLCPTERDRLDELMRARDFKGLNVTIPYKKAVIEYCDRLTDRAEKIGSVNTLYFDNGKMIGENTDYDGFSALASRAGISFAGKRVIILGGGGTSLTAKTVAHDEGAADIKVITRSGETTYDMLSQFADYDIIINTTPVGMFPNNDGRILSLDMFDRLSGVIDVVYNPLKTELVLDAEKRGIPATGGLFMLVAQAKRAAEIFCNTEITEEKLIKTFETVKSSVTNIVLTGMPGCGKSTIAKALAQRLNRRLYDTDSMIEQKHGAISEIFKNYGEAHFRQLESDVICQCAKMSGVIISTGGGAVLSQKNRRALGQNGRIYFIDRNIDSLQLANGRPLSQSRSHVRRLYDERIGIYTSFADVTVDNNSEPERAVDTIAADFD